jgi:hypothetical protein
VISRGVVDEPADINLTLPRRRASARAVALCASREPASRVNSKPNAFTLKAIFEGCWRAPILFEWNLFFTVEACARTAGVAAAYVTCSNETLLEDLWHAHERASRKPVPPFPPSLRLKETQARGLPYLCADKAGNIYTGPLLICRVCFSFCDSATMPQTTA